MENNNYEISHRMIETPRNIVQLSQILWKFVKVTELDLNIKKKHN